MASKQNNLSINITKKVKDLYNENLETLKKDTEDNTKTYQDPPHVHGLAKLVL
jgi:hypothetical protein